MRLALKPGLLPVWRDDDTLQLGIDPRRAVAISGIGRAAALIGLLDGSRDYQAVVAAARGLGITADAADRLIALLAAAGVLDDFPAATLRALPDGLRSRLAPELATAALARGDGDGGIRALARRSATYVRVYGAGKAGTCVATLLAAAGIGQVACRDPALVIPADLAPAGLCPADVGKPRWQAAAAAVSRSAPQARTSDGSRRPDLAVLAGNHGPEVAAGLVAEGVPHLAVSAAEAIGIVGPLVIPGRTTCLHCVSLYRADRDPAWPRIAAQLIGREPVTPACDCVLATAVAALASAQVLAFVDSGGRPGAAANGTLELVLADWQWRRRTWLPHPDCGCLAAAVPRPLPRTAPAERGRRQRRGQIPATRARGAARQQVVEKSARLVGEWKA